MNVAGAHVPHSAKPTLERTQYYQTLAQIYNTHTVIITNISYLGISMQNCSKDFQKKRNIWDSTYL